MYICHAKDLQLSYVCHILICMSYTARDLQRSGKQILDEASKAPVRIRRGNDFFEITKLKFNQVYIEPEAGIVLGDITGMRLEEPTVVADSQEYDPALDDMLKSGQIKRGI